MHLALFKRWYYPKTLLSVFSYFCCPIVLCVFLDFKHALFFFLIKQNLLRDREEVIALEKLFERKPTYFFMDPLFIPLAKTKKWKKPESYIALHNFYCDYGSAAVGPTINNVDFIFVPACVTDNHWILFVFAVKKWGLVILDPLYDEPSYPEEEEIMVCSQ